MSYRYYFKMFKNEPDVLTVPDVVRLLQFGKNTLSRKVGLAVSSRARKSSCLRYVWLNF